MNNYSMTQSQASNLMAPNDICYHFGSTPIGSPTNSVQVFPLNHIQFNINTVVEQKFKQADKH